MQPSVKLKKQIGGKNLIFERIKVACSNKSMTISELEVKAGIGKKTIYRWNSISPSIDKVIRVAAILGIDV